MRNKEDGELGPPPTSSQAVQSMESVQPVQEVQEVQGHVAQVQSSISEAINQAVRKVSQPKREMAHSLKPIKTVEQQQSVKPVKSMGPNEEATNPVKMVQDMVSRVKVIIFINHKKSYINVSLYTNSYAYYNYCIYSHSKLALYHVVPLLHLS